MPRHVRPMILAAAAICLFALARTTPAWAHDPGLSTIRLDAREDAVEIVLTFPAVDGDGDDRTSRAELDETTEFIRQLDSAWLEITSRNRRLVIPKAVITASADGESIVWRTSIPGEPRGRWRVRLNHLSQLPAGHRALVFAYCADGSLAGEALLQAASPMIALDWR